MSLFKLIEARHESGSLLCCQVDLLFGLSLLVDLVVSPRNVRVGWLHEVVGGELSGRVSRSTSALEFDASRRADAPFQLPLGEVVSFVAHCTC